MAIDIFDIKNPLKIFRNTQYGIKRLRISLSKLALHLQEWKLSSVCGYPFGLVIRYLNSKKVVSVCPAEYISTKPSQKFIYSCCFVIHRHRCDLDAPLWLLKVKIMKFCFCVFALLRMIYHVLTSFTDCVVTLKTQDYAFRLFGHGPHNFVPWKQRSSTGRSFDVKWVKGSYIRALYLFCWSVRQST